MNNKYVISIFSLFLVGVAFCLFLIFRPASVSFNHTRRAHANLRSIWFDDIHESVSINEHDIGLLFGLIANPNVTIIKFDENSPFSQKTDNKPRIIFLTLSDGQQSGCVVVGSGNGVYSAFEDARVRAKSEFDIRHCKWIKLDIVQEVYEETFDVENPLKLERSLCGLASKELDIAFLPEEIVTHGLIDSENRMHLYNIARYLGKQDDSFGIINRFQNMKDSKIYRFVTSTYFYAGKNVLPLYRGHRQFDNITRENLIYAARLGGDYLARSLDRKGKFNYIYSPENDKALQQDSNMPSQEYNILRHAGAIYAMLELYEINRDKRLFGAIEKAIDYLLLSVKRHYVNKEFVECVVEDEYIKLGGNALATIVLSKYMEITGNQKYLPNLLYLGRWILNVQGENGEFIVHKQDYITGEVMDFESSYYPGEAILAMLRIYKHDSNQIWLDAAEKGTKYLINNRDHGLPLSDLPHDHWLLYSLNELYDYRPEPLYINHARKICKAIIKSQNKKPQCKDWIGSYYYPPTSVSTAARTEGLCAAYQLIHNHAFDEEAKEILEAILLGIRFQLHTQCRAESSLYFDDPGYVIGGFKLSLKDPEIRIDYVQHNISSLLGLYRILKD